MDFRRAEKANRIIQFQSVFPMGDTKASANFAGVVQLNMLKSKDSIYNTAIGNVTFEPKARTNWLKHPGGQILLVTDGEGYYQERGKPVQLIKKGDMVLIAPGVEHWHGATAYSRMTHLAINTNTQKGNVVWLEPVSDEEYYKIDIK